MAYLFPISEVRDLFGKGSLPDGLFISKLRNYTKLIFKHFNRIFKLYKYFSFQSITIFMFTEKVYIILINESNFSFNCICFRFLAGYF